MSMPNPIYKQPSSGPVSPPLPPLSPLYSIWSDDRESEAPIFGVDLNGIDQRGQEASLLEDISNFLPVPFLRRGAPIVVEDELASLRSSNLVEDRVGGSEESSTGKRLKFANGGKDAKRKKVTEVAQCSFAPLSNSSSGDLAEKAEAVRADSPLSKTNDSDEILAAFSGFSDFRSLSAPPVKSDFVSAFAALEIHRPTPQRPKSTGGFPMTRPNSPNDGEAIGAFFSPLNKV
ncbi:MAG: hypothetical protein KR126chlam1_00664 [Chlamydiae bacterium]|nr:hypothetical protein [Chlamydiota bacterium]